LTVDNVVLCTGQEPNGRLYDELCARGIRADLIGGAELAAELDAKRAIDQGTRLAADLRATSTPTGCPNRLLPETVRGWTGPVRRGVPDPYVCAESSVDRPDRVGSSTPALGAGGVIHCFGALMARSPLALVRPRAVRWAGVAVCRRPP